MVSPVNASRRPCGTPRITRGRGGWLNLPRAGLPPPILCQLSWRTPLRVKQRRTRCEQMSSELPLKADIAQCSRHVSKGATSRHPRARRAGTGRAASSGGVIAKAEWTKGAGFTFHSLLRLGRSRRTRSHSGANRVHRYWPWRDKAWSRRGWESRDCCAPTASSGRPG